MQAGSFCQLFAAFASKSQIVYRNVHLICTNRTPSLRSRNFEPNNLAHAFLCKFLPLKMAQRDWALVRGKNDINF